MPPRFTLTDADYDDMEALIVRTDLTNDARWLEVKAALAEPAGEESLHIIDEPAWAGASIAEIRRAMRDNEYLREYLSAIFVADHITIQSDHHALLAVSNETREDYAENWSPEEAEGYAFHSEFGLEFRTLPDEVVPIHGNLALANMDWSEFAGAAASDPELIYRGSRRPRA